MLRVIGSFLLLLLTVIGGYAGGLSTPYGEIVVENIPPGEVVSITGIAGKPFTVRNTSDMTVHLKIEVVIPQPSELKPGYNPLPDVSWIKLEKSEFDLSPGQEAVSQVSLLIPPKGKYYGKKYQVYLWSHTIPQETGMSLALGLKSRFLLQTIKKKNFFKRLFGG